MTNLETPVHAWELPAEHRATTGCEKIFANHVSKEVNPGVQRLGTTQQQKTK